MNNLLPSGFSDLLPPHARTRRMMMSHVLSAFEAIGAQEVFPAMMEFEESRADDAMRRSTFRAVDPESKKTLALRADMTPQIARIASSSLADAPRPLKLCYGGTNLRVSAGMLEPRRQLTQVGMEIFGDDGDAQLEAQMISIALTVLKELCEGKKLLIDFNMPNLVQAYLAIAKEHGMEDAAALAIRNKAASSEAASALPALSKILNISGDYATALEALKAVTVTHEALRYALEDSIAQVSQLASILKEFEFDVRFTLDPLDMVRAQAYSGVNYALFVDGLKSEIGRGGRYVSEQDAGNSETASGLTLYLDELIEMEE